MPGTGLDADLGQGVWRSPCCHGNRILVAGNRQYMWKLIHFFKKLGFYKPMKEIKQSKCCITIDLSEKGH